MSLAGKESCTGKVTIGHRDKNYWLSGSNSTWNWNSANAVCQQLHCGKASNYSSIPETSNNIWTKSYNCTPNATSLFNCDNFMQAADHTNSTAIVTCTGKKNTQVVYFFFPKTGADLSMLARFGFVLECQLPLCFMTFTLGSLRVSLTEGCWGNVKVCLESKCGGVRWNTWSDEKSQTLCQNLGCGTPIISNSRRAQKSGVMVESLHTVLPNTNLNKSILVLTRTNQDHPDYENSAYVVCSGSESMCTSSV